MRCASVKLIGENYWASGELLLSGGVRFLGDRFSADVGLGGVAGSDDSAFGMPILDVAWRF